MSYIEQLSKLNTPLAGATAQQALQKALQLGVPQRKSEEWRYTSLKGLDAVQFRSSQLSNLALVARDQKDLPQVPFSEGLSFFENVNLATLSTAKKMTVAKNSSEDLKIQIKVLNQEHMSALLVIDVEPHASVRIHEDVSVDSGFLNLKVIVNVSENSKVEYLRTIQPSSQEYSFAVLDTQAVQSSNSTLKYVQLGSGLALFRHNLKADLKAENASCEMYGFQQLGAGLMVDHNIQSNHWASNTQSRQLFKTIVQDDSKSIFQGRIFIEKKAQKSDAEQLCKNMMLSEKCTVDTKPQLDVYADDVKANHGAAIGRLDPQELFYLQSRGLSKEQSLELLMSAYGLEILNKLDSQDLKKAGRDLMFTGSLL